MAKLKKPKEITVTHRKLGKERALGLAYKESKEVVLDSRMEGKEYFLTAIHEGLHCVIPEYVEDKIESVTTELGNFLWNKIDWSKIVEPKRKK